MNKTNIFKAIITRHEPVKDIIGNQHIKVYGKLYVEGANDNSYTEFEVLPLSIIPTIPLGSKSNTILPIGQVVLVYKDSNHNTCYSLGCMSLTQTILPIGTSPLKINEFRLSYLGVDPTNIIFRDGLVEFEVGTGMYLSLDRESRTLDINTTNTSQTFGGGRVTNSLNGNIAAHSEVYTKYKENRVGSDQFLDVNANILNNLPYEDKTVIKYGGIVDSANLSAPFSHLYQVDTRQGVSSLPIKQKDTITTNKAGYQATGLSKGALFDRFYIKADLLSKTANSYRQIEGNLEDGSVKTEQFIYKHSAPFLHSTFRRDSSKILELLTPKEDPENAESWFIRTNYNGVSGRHFAESIGKNSLPGILDFKYYKEISDDNLLLYRITKSLSGGEGFVQKYKNELKENSHIVEIEYDKGEAYYSKYLTSYKNGEVEVSLSTKKADNSPKYLISFKDENIEISYNSGDESDSPKVVLSKNEGIIISPGSGNKNNSIKITSDGITHKLVTEEWVKQVFDKHMHPTAAQGPPSKPIPMPLITTKDQSSHTTYITGVQ